MPQASSIEFLDKLISFDTTSSKSNMNLINYIEEYLLSFGVKSQIIKDEHEDKAN